MGYIVNPKTDGSGVVCAIPHRVKKGVKHPCPQRCRHCFFQGGRSYLEPLHEKLPNMPPPELAKGKIVRFNDGLDSSVDVEMVIAAAAQYEDAFYNTSMVTALDRFDRPVVLTVNPGKWTDARAHLVDPVPRTLMFVRFRADAWNTELAAQVVQHYTSRLVPVVFTFMAYYDQEGDDNGLDDIPPEFHHLYTFKKRTLNSYWVAEQAVWDMVMTPFAGNPLVLTCGPNAGTYPCKFCNNCGRLYWRTKGRLGR